MSHYVVTTPLYTYWDYDPYEPPEQVVDWVAVEANTKREAKIKAVKLMRSKFPRGYINGDPTSNPFQGLSVDTAICEHGVCWCDICTEDPQHKECQICLDNWSKEDEMERYE